MSLIGFFRFCFYFALLSISLLAVLPQQQLVVTTGWDKANHALAFFVLLWLLDYAYPAASLWVKKILPLLIYGLLIECVQSQIPGRYLSLLDFFSDIVGLAAYLLIRPILINNKLFIDAD